MLEILNKLKRSCGLDSANQSLSNKDIKRKQQNLLIAVTLVIFVSIFLLMNLVQEKKKKKIEVKAPKYSNMEVAAESLDPEIMWRNYFEEKLVESQKSFENRLKKAEDSFAEKEQKLLSDTKSTIDAMQAQVSFAHDSMKSAALELKRVGDMQQELLEKNQVEKHISDLSIKDIENEIEFDEPKDFREYIAETSYFSGYLLGGLAVSTALNTADEHAPSVVIRLTNRGNLSKDLIVDIEQCRIFGSAYGDLSSERAIIRAEKLVCFDPKTQLVTTSRMVGTIHGSDGMNGIKGKVIATSSKHIQNAMLGGVISGLASSAQGRDAMSITSLGAVNTKKQGMGDIAGKGILGGASNAAEKIADYYLRMAESMSPVLTVPAGAKVDVLVMKGFYIGEVGTLKRVREERLQSIAKKNINTEVIDE